MKMVNIDASEDIKKLDSQNVLGSIDELPDQCLHAWEEAEKVDVPDFYKDIQNVVMCGMGGSGLGARVIESVYGSDLRLPLVRVNDYNLPGFSDIHTLVICSSYSGETEETLQNAKEAIDRKCKWMAIGSGNSLIKLAQEKGVPCYIIDAKYNPSNQPRMAIGYSIVGQLVLASKVGLFKLQKSDIDESAEIMKTIQTKSHSEITENDNPAKQLARSMYGKVIIYVSSGHLIGAMHTVNNQLNENTKNMSTDVFIPELNHHLMEGLKHPEMNPQNLFFIFADSNLYPERIKKRFTITKEVVEKNNIGYFEYTLNSINKLTQSFELIQFGAYTNFYLSMLYDTDPAPIPWVDYFKEQLGQPLGK